SPAGTTPAATTPSGVVRGPSGRALMTGVGSAVPGALGGATATSALGSAGTAPAGTAPAAAAGPAAGRRTAAPGYASFTWLGTSGWKIRTTHSTVLVDPYDTRFETVMSACSYDACTPFRVEVAAPSIHLTPTDALTQPVPTSLV